MAHGGKREGAGRKQGAIAKATKGEVKSLAELAREYAPMALRVLKEIAESGESPGAARVAAANALLDRGYGRPPQAVEHSGKDGGPLVVRWAGE